MDMVLDLVAHARLAEKRQVNQAEHIEGGHQRGRVADEPQDAIGPAFRSPRLPEDFILGKESGERRDPGDGERGDQHSAIGDGDAMAEVSHVAHVLLAAHGVDHRPGAEEQQSLEERVSEDMEDGGGEGSNAEREEHVPELRDGGVREDALDVVLNQSDGGGEDGGERTDDRDGLHRCRRQHE